MAGSLYRLIRDCAPADLDQPVLVPVHGAALSYGDLFRAAGRYGTAMAAAGVAPGDRVAVLVEKSPQALITYLACLRAGFAFLPMNTAYRAAEVGHVLGDAEPALVICDPARADEIGALAPGPVLTLDGGGRGSLAAAAAAAQSGIADAELAGDDLAALLYTSGTTGRPKGAMLSHRNLAANGLVLRDSWGFTGADVLLHALPIFHAHGLFVACHCVLLAGARMIWLDRFHQAEVIRNLTRATVFMGVPTFYGRLMADADFDAAACARIRLFVSGSAPLLAETHRAFEARTGHVILERYGMTETGMNSSNPLAGERRAGTVGFPLPGTEIRITGEDGRVLPTGEIGLVEVQGDNVFAGYWRLPDKTAEEFDGPWFKTGDLGHFDADGYLHLVGRSKDLIISGGFNVYPKEIEGVIDGLAGVAESAVIGVAHPDFGEGVVAVVVREAGSDAPDEAAVIAAAKAELANFKLPKRVFFRDALPRNTMGKVQKNRLREEHVDAFRG